MSRATTPHVTLISHISCWVSRRMKWCNLIQQPARDKVHRCDQRFSAVQHCAASPSTATERVRRRTVGVFIGVGVVVGMFAC